MNFFEDGGIVMGQKLGVLCLSVMAIAFAAGYSVNRNVSIRTNATANETLKEIRSEKKTKCKYETDTVSDNFLSVGDSDISFKNIIDNNDKISQKEVTITLNSVIRGEEAQKEVDNFNSTNPISKIPKLVDASLEYVIIEYTITLPNNTT